MVIQEKDIDWRLVAWCLALEGSIGMYMQSSRNDFAPVLKLYNTDRNVVMSFMEMVDCGCVYLNKNNGGKRSNKPLYFWRLQSFSDVKVFLNNIIEYLPSKKRQAELLLEFVDIRLSNNHKWRKLRESSYSTREMEIYNEMKKLNRRGGEDD